MDSLKEFDLALTCTFVSFLGPLEASFLLLLLVYFVMNIRVLGCLLIKESAVGQELE